MCIMIYALITVNKHLINLRQGLAGGWCFSSFVWRIRPAALLGVAAACLEHAPVYNLNNKETDGCTVVDYIQWIMDKAIHGV